MGFTGVYSMNNIMFETKNFIVFLPSRDDLENLIKLYTNKDVMVFFGGVRTKVLIEKLMGLFLENYKLDGFGYGLVHRKSDNNFIGRVGLNRYELKKHENRIEAGILLLPEYWNSGCATELVAALINYAREIIKLNILHATIDKTNFGSIKLAQKLGFTFSNEVLYCDILKNLYIKDLKK